MLIFISTSVKKCRYLFYVQEGTKSTGCWTDYIQRISVHVVVHIEIHNIMWFAAPHTERHQYIPKRNKSGS